MVSEAGIQDWLSRMVLPPPPQMLAESRRPGQMVRFLLLVPDGYVTGREGATLGWVGSLMCPEHG